MAEERVQIPAARPHQKPVLDDPSRFKILRWGRRAGKTSIDLIAATLGHGAQPNGRGMADGGDILWVYRDFTNAQVAWKQLKQIFAGKKGFDKSEQWHTITFHKGGSVRIVSADNIDSVRGDKWDGAIIDEAAHMKLNDVFWNVVRPGLADRHGWAIFTSTTWPGSYFNDLCKAVMAGERRNWKHFYATGWDNDMMDPVELQEMADDYDDEMKRDCEVFAKLVVPGGLAFPQWEESVHVYDFNPPMDWPWVGCIDYGWHQGWFGLGACGPEGNIHFRIELAFSETAPYDLGAEIAHLIHGKHPLPMFIVHDSAMGALMDGTLTVAQKFQAGLLSVLRDEAPPVVPGPKGPGSRSIGTTLFREALGWKKPGDWPLTPLKPWMRPKLTFHPQCPYAIRTIPSLPRSPTDIDDVDTNAEDHAFDAIKYLLMYRTPRAERREPPQSERMKKWMEPEPQEDGYQYGEGLWDPLGSAPWNY